jgi:hypothetical protein
VRHGVSFDGVIPSGGKQMQMQQQIPPLRCGMTNKKATADPSTQAAKKPPSLRMTHLSFTKSS